MSRARLLPSLVAAGLTALAAGGARAATATEGDVSLGSAKAPVTVIEYASVTCPHCARWEAEVYPAFKRKYVDTGKVRYVLRELPTEPEELSEAGFMIARCAAPAKFYDVIEALMAAQKDLYTTHNALPWLMRGAAVAGLNERQMRDCVGDEAGQKALQARVEANEKAFQIEGTPTFIINGKKAGDGELTLVELDKAIAAAGAPPAPRHAAPAASKKTRPKSKPKSG